MSAFMAAFKALMACLTLLRNGLYGGSFLRSEFGPGKAAIKADISRPDCRETLALSRLLNVVSGTDLCKRTFQDF